MKSTEQLRRDFWEQDMRNGSPIRRQYDEIHRVLSECDLDWVNRQYDALKQHAIDHTAFYHGFRSGDEFPVVNKASILAHYEQHRASKGFDLPLHFSSTSGSTGIPFTVPQNYSKRMRAIADLKVFGELCDYPSHERMILLRVVTEKMNRTPEREEKENIYYVDSSDLSSSRLQEITEVILEKRPRILFSYASTLVELAKYIQSRALSPDLFSMKSVLTAGEGISTENRQLLEEVFGCTVYRRYADMEFGILAQDMGNESAYRLNYGSFRFECLKMDSDEPAEDHEVGRIVVTDLFNYAFPMIRYDTGDLGIAVRDPRTGFLQLKEIYGRVRDCVYTTDGRLLSPAKISVSMWGVTGIRQWQFIQHDEKEYELKLNLDFDVDCEPVLQKLWGIVGQDAHIRVTRVEEIPVLSSHKREAVICHYHKK